MVLVPNEPHRNMAFDMPFLAEPPDHPEELAFSAETLEIISGEPDFVPAWFLAVGAARAQAVCLINASGTNYRGEQGTWSGTGFLVSPNILLTNHHVLNSADVARAAVCQFNYQVSESGQPEPVQRFRLRPDRLFVTDPVTRPTDQQGLDFTFVWVDGEPGKQFEPIPLNRSSTSVKANQPANVVQHPEGRPKEVVVQRNEITEAQKLLVIRYNSDTLPGSSGSCVFNNAWTPIALHHASRRADDDPSRFENEGVRLSAIATFLEELARDTAQRPAARELLALFQGTDARLGFFGSLGRDTPPDDTGVEAVVLRYKGEPDDVDVGFWNVEWFVRDYDRKKDDVARIILDLNLDIWAFEESSRAATEALVEHLKDHYQAEFKFQASEPDAPSNKQTTTVIWNPKTVNGERQTWPAEVESWFKVDSRQFDELRLEAVEGPVFPRYPALFHFEALDRQDEAPFDFYLVPLHLKAMDEGSKRRRQAVQILGAAVKKMIEAHGADADWVIGGDFNADLASGDFASLLAHDWVPLSAGDEANGAVSYIKQPKSLIDQIYLSKNLADSPRARDYFVVARDREFPDYVQRVSDHRPVLVRLSLKSAAPEAAAGEAELAVPARPASAAPPAIRELFSILQPASPPAAESLPAVSPPSTNGAQPKQAVRCVLVTIHGIGNQPEDWSADFQDKLDQRLQTLGDDQRDQIAYEPVWWADLSRVDQLEASALAPAAPAGTSSVTYELAYQQYALYVAAGKTDELEALELGIPPLDRVIGNVLARVGDTTVTVRDQANDVANYVSNNGVRLAIQRRLSDKLFEVHTKYPGASVILGSHSQGTIIAYDVLRLNGAQYSRVDTWVTMGCPLGWYLNFGRWGGEQLGIPPSLKWLNFWDSKDPVGRALSSMVTWEKPRPDDVDVNNHGRGLDPHDHWHNPDVVQRYFELLQAHVAAAVGP
jgi:V8-like Glu-specific endopeptidase